MLVSEREHDVQIRDRVNHVDVNDWHSIIATLASLVSLDLIDRVTNDRDGHLTDACSAQANLISQLRRTRVPRDIQYVFLSQALQHSSAAQQMILLWRQHLM